MQSDFERCLANVIVDEGGYSDDKHDPGGATMEGITQLKYNAWRRSHKMPIQWVHHISADELREIYKSEYWDKTQCDCLPVGLDYCVFDEAVNSGVARARKALASMSPNVTPELEIRHFNDVRLAFLKSLSTWRYFGDGWTSRIEKVEKIAEIMVEQAAEAQIKTAQAPAQAVVPNDPGNVSAGVPPQAN